MDPASLVPPVKMGFEFNRLSFDAKAAREILETELDPYELNKLFYTQKRTIQVTDAQPLQESDDTAQTQTLMVIFSRPENPEFAGITTEHSVQPRGFRKPLAFSLWRQPNPAPIAFVLPGLGGHRKSANAMALAEIAHLEGYHVICFSNNFNWEFIRHAPEGYLPGYTPRDIELIQRAHQAIEKDFAAAHGADRILGKSHIGFSMGAWYALNLAAQNPPGTFDHSVAINPPLDLVHGLKVLDRLYRAPQREDPARLAAIRESAFIKVLYNRNSDPKEGPAKPFTDAEASHLIGLSYRVTLREAIITGKFDRLLTPLTPRRKLYDRINAISYEDYYEKLIKPHLESRGISATQLDTASDLRNRMSGLVKAGSVHLFLTGNDFLLTSEHLAWFREHFPGHHTYNEKGGHMGNLWEPKIQDALRGQIRSPSSTR